jgi:hypothetical protein
VWVLLVQGSTTDDQNKTCPAFGRACRSRLGVRDRNNGLGRKHQRQLLNADLNWCLFLEWALAVPERLHWVDQFHKCSLELQRLLE